MTSQSSIAEAVAMRMLEAAVRELPELGFTLGRLVHDAPDDLPLVERLRQILPATSASDLALRSLRRGG
jgi:hypothetical protein